MSRKDKESCFVEISGTLRFPLKGAKSYDELLAEIEKELGGEVITFFPKEILWDEQKGFVIVGNVYVDFEIKKGKSLDISTLPLRKAQIETIGVYDEESKEES